MKYCEKCGNELTDEAAFCPKCGTKCSQDNTEVNVEQQNKNSASVDLPIQENTSPAVQYYGQEVPPTFNTQQYAPTIVAVKKKNPLKIIIPIVSVVIILSGCLFVYFTFFSNPIVTANEEGDKVFNFTPKEYIEMFNEANSEDLSHEFELDDFKQTTNDDGDELFKCSGNGVSIILFTDGSGFGSHVETIKFWTEEDDKDLIKKGIFWELKAIYPKLSDEQLIDILEQAQNKWQVNYKDITISYEYDSDYNTQSWFINPKK